MVLYDPTKPTQGSVGTPSPPISADLRNNYEAIRADLGSKNWVRDNGFFVWAGGVSTVPTHYSRQSGAGSAIALEDTTVYGGATYAIKLTGATAASEYVQQEIIPSAYFPSFLQSEPWGLGCWVYGGAADSADIGIYDGVDTYWSGDDESNWADNGDWTWLTLQYALDAAATEITIRMRTAQGVVSYFCLPTLLMGGAAPAHVLPSPSAIMLLGPGPIQGDLPSSQTYINGWRDPATIPYYVQRTRLVAGTAPTGQAAILDVNKNGTSMYSTLPQIAAGDTDNLPGAEPDSATYSTRCFTAGDLMSVDVDQRGSGTYGADVTTKVECVCFPHVAQGWFPGLIAETGA